MKRAERFPKVLEMMHYLKEYAPRPTKVNMPSVCKFFEVSTITAYALRQLGFIKQVGNKKSGTYVWNKEIKYIGKADALIVVNFVREYEKAHHQGTNYPRGTKGSQKELQELKNKVQKQVKVKKAEAVKTSLSHFMVEVPGTSIKLKVTPIYN